MEDLRSRHDPEYVAREGFLMTQAWKLGSAVAFALAAACCAGSDAPLHSESSTSAIRAAEAVGADQVPQAALHLQLANEELNAAHKLAADGKKDEANSLLRRAEADAELAVLLSNEKVEQTEAARAMERVRKLQADNRSTH
jgi:hypothetical protein